MRFRLRLLYKSHIATATRSQRQAESHYACLFCALAGATVREGDATVFTTPDHLLLHLARHPQPLPEVEGVRVVYGGGSDTAGDNDSDNDFDHDFDLHFVRPPLPSPPTPPGTATATATREHVQRYGAKKLPRPSPYGGDMLPFLAGARIVGISFPDKWDGKWCLGWHDGVAGAFPARAVQLEPPRPSEVPMASSSSGMSVTARWAWRMDDGKKGKKDRDDAAALAGDDDAVWLSFAKGETIANVKCEAPPFFLVFLVFCRLTNGRQASTPTTGAGPAPTARASSASSRSRTCCRARCASRTRCRRCRRRRPRPSSARRPPPRPPALRAPAGPPGTCSRAAAAAATPAAAASARPAAARRPR